jgi:hypothetical protein
MSKRPHFPPILFLLSLSLGLSLQSEARAVNLQSGAVRYSAGSDRMRPREANWGPGLWCYLNAWATAGTSSEASFADSLCSVRLAEERTFSGCSGAKGESSKSLDRNLNHLQLFLRMFLAALASVPGATSPSPSLERDPTPPVGLLVNPHPSSDTPLVGVFREPHFVKVADHTSRLFRPPRLRPQNGSDSV